MPVGCVTTSAEWCRVLAGCPFLCWEGPARVGCARTPIDTRSGCEGEIHNPALAQVHLLARCKHMFSNSQGQHIPLPQCSMMLPKALLQRPSSLADITPRALVTRDGVDHSLSPQFWNRVLGGTSSCLSAWNGQKATLMTRWLSTLWMDWDNPWMYGMVTDVHAVCLSSWSVWGSLSLCTKATGLGLGYKMHVQGLYRGGIIATVVRNP